MPYRYFPIEFSSYEDYVKYLKEKGFAVSVIKENNSYNLNEKSCQNCAYDRKNGSLTKRK